MDVRDQSPSDATPAEFAEIATSTDATDSDPDADAPPMSMPLLARLFLVPAILVAVLVVGLMTVVLLFGWPGLGERPDVKTLIATMQADSGDRQAGRFFPAAKESWQAAQELAERLKNRDKEMSPAEIEPTVAALAAMFPPAAAESSKNAGQHQKAMFLLMALARLGTDSAADALASALTTENAELRMTALRSLAEMEDRETARRYVARILPLLDDPAGEVQLIACATVGQIAAPGDAEAVRALADKLTGDREIQWNAALALARLNSPAGKMALLSMLDRAYWGRQRVQYTAAGGAAVDRPLSPAQIEQYVLAALDGAARLNDSDLAAEVGRLQNDPSPVIRDRAIKAMKSRRH